MSSIITTLYGMFVWILFCFVLCCVASPAGMEVSRGQGTYSASFIAVFSELRRVAQIEAQKIFVGIQKSIMAKSLSQKVQIIQFKRKN